jgi:electron transport complex protein RnfB
MSDDVYTRLREFMDKLPAGYPETPTGVEIKLLKKMFTPEQAELTVKLTEKPESVAEIAARTGLDEGELTERLEDLAQNGLIFRVREGNERLYHAFQFIIGLYEFQLNRLDREFCDLFEEYLPYIGISLASVKTGQLRVVPVESALKENPQVAPYNQIREMVEREDLFSVTPCICRKEQGLLGNECSKPSEVCLMFGKFARYYIDNNLGRQITKDEALKTLDLAEENGLVLQPSNTQKLDAICCCCTCCCPGLRFNKALPNPGEMVTSSYTSIIDSDACSDCGECMEICPMEATKEEDGAVQVMVERCIGCGLCVDRCPAEAISMQARESQKEPPATFDDVLIRIADERNA